MSPELPTSHCEQASPFGWKGIHAKKARGQAGWHTLRTTSAGSRQSPPAGDVTLPWNWASGKQRYYYHQHSNGLVTEPLDGR